MAKTVFENTALLHDACLELVRALQDAREQLTDEQFESMQDSHACDIVCAAMDVEYYVEKITDCDRDK